MSLTAFVTGASGFLGAHVARMLHEQGWQVHVLARPSSSLAELGGARVTVHEGDLAAPGRLTLPGGLDAVFHLAASTNLWSARNDEQTRVNVDGTARLLEASIRAEAGRFVHTSSFVAWGFPAGEFDENSPRDASHDWINYVRTKHLSECVVLDAASSGQIDAVVLNPANVLGPGDWRNWSRLFRLIQQGKLPGAPPGGGSFCDVREVARAHLAAFDRGRSGRKYLLGGPFGRYLEVIRLGGDALGKPVPARPTPAWLMRAVGRIGSLRGAMSRSEPDLTPEGAAIVCSEIRCNSGRAERELGYRSPPLDEMVRDTVAWMKSRGLLK